MVAAKTAWLALATIHRPSGRPTVILLQRKRPHRAVRGHEHILPTVYGVGLRRVLDGADLGVPQRHRGPPPPQAKGDYAPGSVAGEQQTARRREQTGSATAPTREVVFPRERARLVIDRDDGTTERSHDVLLAASQPHEHAWIFVRQVIHRVDLPQPDI